MCLAASRDAGEVKGRTAPHGELHIYIAVVLVSLFIAEGFD